MSKITSVVTLLRPLAIGEKTTRWLVSLESDAVYTINIPTNKANATWSKIHVNPVHLMKLTDSQRKRAVNQGFDIVPVVVTEYTKGDRTAKFSLPDCTIRPLPVCYEQIPLVGKKYDYIIRRR